MVLDLSWFGSRLDESYWSMNFTLAYPVTKETGDKTETFRFNLRYNFLMNYLKNFFLLIFLFLSLIFKAEDKVSYIDIDYILTNTIAGKTFK